MTTEILAAVRAADRARPWRRQKADLRPLIALAPVGIVALLTATLFLWSTADAHTLRDLAAFQLALGIGYSEDADGGDASGPLRLIPRRAGIP